MRGVETCIRFFALYEGELASGLSQESREELKAIAAAARALREALDRSDEGAFALSVLALVEEVTPCPSAKSIEVAWAAMPLALREEAQNDPEKARRSARLAMHPAAVQESNSIADRGLRHTEFLSRIRQDAETTEKLCADLLAEGKAGGRPKDRARKILVDSLAQTLVDFGFELGGAVAGTLAQVLSLVLPKTTRDTDERTVRYLVEQVAKHTK